MTDAQFRAGCDQDIRAMSVAIAPCVCGELDVEPELRRVRCNDELHEVSCQVCRRGLYGPSKASAISMWNAMMSVKPHDAEPYYDPLDERDRRRELAAECREDADTGLDERDHRRENRIDCEEE